MSSQQPGSGRRRIAGDAARRRRESADSTTEQAQDASVETPVEESTEPTQPEPDETADSATAEPAKKTAPDTEEARSRGPRRPAFSAPPRDTWWWLGAIAVITVCAIVFAGVVGARYLSERGDDESLAEARDDATSAAATSAEEILSYDFASFDSERTDAADLMTSEFRKQYDELYSGKYCDVIPEQNCSETGSFTEVIKKRKQKVEASVVNVAPLECGDDCTEDKATVLLFIDQATSSNGKQLQPRGTQAKFTMVERDGEWLVDGIV